MTDMISPKTGSRFNSLLVVVLGTILFVGLVGIVGHFVRWIFAK